MIMFKWFIRDGLYVCIYMYNSFNLKKCFLILSRSNAYKINIKFIYVADEK